MISCDFPHWITVSGTAVGAALRQSLGHDTGHHRGEGATQVRTAPTQEARPGRTQGPVVYLLVGLTGSGKMTYAKRRLEQAGVVRLTVDERVYARHGCYGVDYPERDYLTLEAPVVAEVRHELIGLVTAGRSAVLGVWCLREPAAGRSGRCLAPFRVAERGRCPCGCEPFTRFRRAGGAVSV